MKINLGIAFFLMVSTIAFSSPNYVSGIQIGQNNELIIKLKNPATDPSVSCQSNNIVAFYDTHASYKSFLSIALTALSTGMPINFRPSSCIGVFGVSNYAYTVNVGNSAYFEISSP
jgi:hypothetical protein